jgi:hypothetical protein
MCLQIGALGKVGCLWSAPTTLERHGQSKTYSRPVHRQGHRNVYRFVYCGGA